MEKITGREARIMGNLVIIQARMGSSRLPGKVLMELAGHPALWHVIQRARQAKLADEVIVATTIVKRDLEIIKFCADNGIRVFAGSENDVLDRYYQAAKLFRPDNVIRITADCPLHDPDIIDKVIQKHMEEGNDYTSNTIKFTYPDGLDCEAMKFYTLADAWKNARLSSEREHVTQYIIKNEHYKKGCLENDTDKSSHRWTLDKEEDYIFIKKIYDCLWDINHEFSSNDIYKLLEKNPEIKQLNEGIIRNEGLLESVKNDIDIEYGDGVNEQ